MIQELSAQKRLSKMYTTRTNPFRIIPAQSFSNVQCLQVTKEPNTSGNNQPKLRRKRLPSESHRGKAITSARGFNIKQEQLRSNKTRSRLTSLKGSTDEHTSSQRASGRRPSSCQLLHTMIIQTIQNNTNANNTNTKYNANAISESPKPLQMTDA